MRRQYIGKRICQLWRKRRKQSVELFGVVAAPIVAQAGTQLLRGLVNKIFGARRRKIRFQRRKRKRCLWNAK